MAKFNSQMETKIYQVQSWLGVNENPDGDVRLKLGEAAELRNWRVTTSGSLQIRPGTRTLIRFDGPVRGMWTGRVSGRDVTVCAAEGRLWEIDLDAAAKTEIGELTDAATEFFGYSENLYIMNGSEYKVWNGEGAAQDVVGYRPLTAVAVVPDGGGTSLEQANKLNGMRRIHVSPDGTATVFKLPEKDIASVDYVKDMETGEDIESGWTADTEAGTVTFATAPEKGTNTLEIGWTFPEDDRETVCAMRFAEIYSGATDNRVFIYGDGSNQALYSGLDENGKATAEYFPDLNVLHAGEANTPITAMIRHFTRLIIFKTGSTYSAAASTISLADDSVTAAFYVSTLNKEIGNDAPGQCVLVDNNPRSLHKGISYMWKSSGGYLSSQDERTAKRLSDRVNETLGRFDMERTIAFDHERNQDYYIVADGTAVIHNYKQDAWFIYTDFPATSLLEVGRELYMGTEAGEIRHISRNYRNDDGEAIDAFWRSGSMAFDRDWRRKYSAAIWVAMKPESGGRVVITARSDRYADHSDSVVAYGLSGFGRVNFNHWSFGTNRRPQVKRVRLRVKKFAYYQLIFESNSRSGAATIALGGLYADSYIALNEWEAAYAVLSDEAEDAAQAAAVAQTWNEMTADELDRVKKEKEELQNELKSARWYLDFYETRIAFVVSGSNYYHTIYCSVYQNADTFWAYNVEAAKSRGHTACPTCWWL